VNTTFVSQDVWPELTRAARGSRRAGAAAVAYFGAGASRLLPLPKGSRLVVDASERAVASGQTCPADLIKLSRRGVAIFSVQNLHAKVFVLGKTAYIGSANVSRHSATALVEAAVRTTEPRVVRAARDFVQDNCLYKLSPGVLKHLAKLYHPPKFHGPKRGAKPVAETSARQALPPLFIARLQPKELNERDQAQHDVGWNIAKKLQKHPRSWVLDSFWVEGKCDFHFGEEIMQVTEISRDKFMVNPPGIVLPVPHSKKSRSHSFFFFLEYPAQRRVNVNKLAQALGPGSLKLLLRDGRVRNDKFEKQLRKYWAR